MPDNRRERNALFQKWPDDPEAFQRVVVAGSRHITVASPAGLDGAPAAGQMPVQG